MKKLTIAAVIVCVSVIALYQNCSEAVFSSRNTDRLNGVFNTCTIQNLLIEDSFERTNVDDPGTANLFGWRKIVNDQGTFVGSSGNQINAKIYTFNQMGVPADGMNSLYFYGRPGSSIHNIYLISETLSLNGYDELGLSFYYLPVELEQNSLGAEYLRVEVCDSTPDNCGAGATLNATGLKSTHWKTIFEAAPKQGQKLGGSFDGRNHKTADWIKETVIIDLNKFPKSNFIIRFNVFLDEGFKSYNKQTPILTSGMEDGLVLDDVVAATVRCN